MVSCIKNDEYWKDKLNDKKYYPYVILHKSDVGNSINLKESENSTRILSIHASKGNGCEVVFVLGLSEFALTIFNKKKYKIDEDNLVYDSLLHVSMTRQKKSLTNPIKTAIAESTAIIGSFLKKKNWMLSLLPCPIIGTD